MPRGGARAGAGRKPGVATTATADITIAPGSGAGALQGNRSPPVAAGATD
jgi:hypothetical protein